MFGLEKTVILYNRRSKEPTPNQKKRENMDKAKIGEEIDIICAAFIYDVLILFRVL